MSNSSASAFLEKELKDVQLPVVNAKTADVAPTMAFASNSKSEPAFVRPTTNNGTWFPVELAAASPDSPEELPREKPRNLETSTVTNDKPPNATRSQLYL